MVIFEVNTVNHVGGKILGGEYGFELRHGPANLSEAGKGSSLILQKDPAIRDGRLQWLYHVARLRAGKTPCPEPVWAHLPSTPDPRVGSFPPTMEWGSEWSGSAD